MNVPELLQQLSVGAIIELFTVSTVPIGGTDVFNFHAGTNNVNAAIVWQGITYQPFPVQAEGFDKSIRGTLPRPRLRIANVTGIMTAINAEFDDLVGAEVRRKQTFAQYLDGQPGADPSQGLPDDIFYVEKKIGSSKVSVEYELASALDLAGVQLPSRDIVANVCPSDYRGTECSYAGSLYFNVKDETVATLDLDVCSKAVSGCKKRFAATGNLPFGGFPASRAYKA